MKSTNHYPKALPFLFLTEMWERFGYYVVQGMLVLYMTQSFGLSDDESYTLNGSFMALAYISPILGGWIADRLLGFKQAIAWGGVFLIVGYAVLALPWSQGFYLALATIIVGNGLFKPNISSLLGLLYPPHDTRRDAGFTIFYIGINIGTFLAGISSGYMKDHFGWHAGFALASVGLVIGLTTFVLGALWGNMKYHYTPSPLQKKWFLSKPCLLFYYLIAIVLLTCLLKSSFLGKWLLPTIGIALLFFVFILAYQQQPHYRNNLLTLNILIISSIVFWAIYLQIFNSANLFIDRLVDRKVWNITIPTTAFYTINSLAIILFGSLLAWMWDKLNQNNKDPSPFIKFVLALIFSGLAALTLGVSTYFPMANNMISPLWIVFSYLLMTVGELLLSPIGLSAVTILSPPRLTGMMMGIWFVALGFGGQFAGMLAKLSSIPKSATDAATQLPIYRYAFMHFTYLAFVVAFILFIVQALVKKNLQKHKTSLK